jgi:26S proteasome non-ATPase regulatory subunit 10
LIHNGAEVDKPDNMAWTPLHIAGKPVKQTRVAFRLPDLNYFYTVSAGYEDIVKELVGAGADVKKTNDKGITPL